MVSIIIPIYNEESTITDCLDSLSKQSYSNSEIIVVDDGSDKNFKFQISNFKLKFPRINFLEQKHMGAGPARNLGASKAKGDILVFVDADMTFDPEFIKKLVYPIENGKSKGTFTKEEYVSNWNNPYARSWNYFQGIPDKRRIPIDFPDESPVFRAILKSEFIKADGFSDIGFTDDWTLSRKLEYCATEALGAVCYHHNPNSLSEIYTQARWIGKNEFISGNIPRKCFNLIRYSMPVQGIRTLILLIRFGEPYLIPFSFVYSIAVTESIFLSFISEKKSK